MSSPSLDPPSAADAVHHHHYDHYSIKMADRLDQFYGRVDDGLNGEISEWVVGESVLDVGCGFGSLVDHLRLKGFAATGVDLLSDGVAAGKVRYPHADLRVASSDELEFQDKSFDTVVLKDVIHHVYEEDDIGEFLADVRRVARRRLIILDPNPMFILLLARRIIGHVDPVCSPRDASRALVSAGFHVVKLRYSNLLTFPLSGGYVGPVLVPSKPTFIGSALIALDRALGFVTNLLGLSRFFAWRYLLVADIVEK